MSINSSIIGKVSKNMKVKIIFDNEAKNNLKSGWGFACLVNEHLLFDTGADLKTLEYNLTQLNVDLNKIDTVFFSHEHGDHTWGYGIIKKLKREKINVITPKSFSTRFKKILKSFPNVNLVEVSEPVELRPGYYSTGEMGAFTPEQSLIVETTKGNVIVTGCSHPGLENIIERAKRFGKIYGVIGGFHDFSKLEILQELKLICPCHCTRAKDPIKNLYPETTIECRVGCDIEI